LKTVNIQYLRSGRNLEVPFRVMIKADSSSSELICNKIIRILVGKRIVCDSEWHQKPVVAKIFLNSIKAERHFKREIKGINALKNGGIKTPVILFQGNIQQNATPVLLFQKVTPSLNLQEVFETTKTDEKRIALLKQLAALIAEHHEAGLKQTDLHLGNFLLSENDIYTIDGATIDTSQKGKSLSEAISIKNLGLFLAQLNSSFEHLFYVTFQAYKAKRSWHVEKNLFDHLLKEVKSQRKKRHKKYLHKIFRESTSFIYHKSWNSYMVCKRNFYYGKMKQLIADPDSVIVSSRLLKDGNSSTVALTLVNNKLIVVKRYNIKNFIHGLKRCPRKTRAWASWLNAHKLKLLNIPTPKPIAFFEKRWGPFRSTSYYISEYIDGTDLKE